MQATRKKISEIIQECVRMGIEVLPPDINESFSPFTVVPTSTNDSTSDAYGKREMRGVDEEHTETYQVCGEGEPESTTKQIDPTRVHAGRIRFGLTT
ncbi:hypothetical protein LDC_0526, partial [sediment metagenome]